MSWSSKHGIGKRNHLHNAHREHRDRYVAPPGQGHATCDPNTEVPKMLFPTQWENALPHAVGKYRRLRRGWGSPELATPHSLGEW